MQRPNPQRPQSQSRPCPDCSSEASVSRREFVQRTGAAALAAGAFSLTGRLPGAFAAPTSSSPAETNVQQLFQLLTPEQRKEVCFPFNDERRSRINANWHVAEHRIQSDFYTPDQKRLIAEIFRGVTSEEGHERFLKQMEYDDGGFEAYSMAIFGEPGTGKFEWALTGRHLTIRADGDSVEGAAFGGPIIYGHGDEEPEYNIFYYQTKQANEVFKALDAPQAKQALLEKAPQETAVQLQGESGKFRGLKVSELSGDQKELVSNVIRVLLAPYRNEDAEEAMAIMEQGGGLDSLHMAFYKEEDLNNDQEWDIWRIEGPTFVSHFRGAPHVHAYLNIGTRKA